MGHNSIAKIQFSSWQFPSIGKDKISVYKVVKLDLGNEDIINHHLQTTKRATKKSQMTNKIIHYSPILFYMVY